MPKPQILVVDDESVIRLVLKNTLQKNDCEVRTAGSAEEALKLLTDWEPAVAMLDIVLPGKSGIQLLGEIKQLHKDTEVLMMTSNSNADTALQAIRLGAYDYLNKPFELSEIWDVVHRVLERRRLTLKSQALLDAQEARSRELSSAVALNESGLADTGIEAITEISDDLIALVARELRVDHASLMLLDADTGQMRVMASRGPETLLPSSADPARLAERGKGAYISTLGDGFAMYAPVTSDHKVFGWICVVNGPSKPPFGTDDLSHLTRAANQLARTVEQARRADRLQKVCESLRAAQEQLVFAERIKAVGQMAAGVAHDFNNVLGVILARTEFIQQTLNDSPVDADKIRRHTETIIKTVMQGSEAIKRVQDYTRIRKGVTREPVDLNAIIDDAIEISRPKWQADSAFKGQQIEIVRELSETREVSGNRYELTQVFGNLLFNAVEAMPEGGTVTFRSRVEGDTVHVEVQDTGTGMDEETRKRLFEPFFSTKESGQGLGTSILYGIVTRHGGELTVESAPGEGTTFRVTLPVAATLEESVAPPAEEESVEAKGVDVLVVDDNELVRETFEELLSFHGHRVVTVCSGEQALKAMNEQRFDVAIVDQNMTGMSGLELAKRVSALYPGTPFILCSGGTLDANDEAVRAAGIDRLLTKPITMEQLQQAVAASLKENCPA